MLKRYVEIPYRRKLINLAVKLLNKIVSKDTFRLYLVNPDGSRIPLKPGFDIEGYEYIVIDDID